MHTTSRFFPPAPAPDATHGARVVPLATSTSRWVSRVALLVILALGAGVGAIDLWRPLDGRSRELWREADVAGIARNFSRDGMHLLHPQVDWRGDGPGYVEMEFPIYPYVMAVGYQIFGVHEESGRVLSYLATLAALFVFVRLAEHVLPRPGAWAAGIFFAASPLVVRIASAIQPEAFMLLGYVSAVYAYIRWLDSDDWSWYGWAIALTSFAILAKAPAAHVGIVFVLLTVWRQGWGAFRRVRLWMLATAALAAPIAWYVQAHAFWLAYGNSLGATNEHHWAGLALFTTPRFVSGILGLELSQVWMIASLAIPLALALDPRSRAFRCGLLWYGAVVAYYFVIAGTSAFGWASYYHVVSVPPVALLFGAAVVVAWERLGALAPVDQRRAATMTAGILGLAIVAGVLHRNPVLGVIAGTAIAAATAVRPSMRRALMPGLLAGVAAAVPIRQLQVASARQPASHVHEYETALVFKSRMAPGVLIGASGRYCAGSVTIAHEQPWYFYWTDHKGFSPCAQDHSIGRIRALAGRGARYFIADQSVLMAHPDFEADMREAFPVVAETPSAVLFRIDTDRSSELGRQELTHHRE